MGKLSKDVLGAVKKKTGKSIAESDIRRVAKGVGPGTMRDERQLRQLIKQVGQLANVNVSESTVKELISAIKKSGVSQGNMEQMIQMLMKRPNK